MSASTDAVASPIEAVISSAPHVLLVASMEDCPPCLLMKPAMRALASTAGAALTMVEVMLEDNQPLLERLGVTSFPTLLAFRDGALVDQRTGYSGAADLDEVEAFLTRCFPRIDPAVLSVTPLARTRLAEAKAALEAISQHASDALEPLVDAANAAMEPLLEAVDAELAAGRISKQQASQQRRDVIAAAYAPFQDKVVALRAANQEGFALYARMTETLAAAPTARVMVCDPESGVCRLE